MSDRTNRLKLEEVSVRFSPPTSRRNRSSGLVAIDDIDLDVATGEFVCILGPSGCGKSTLLNLIAGFIAPTHGRILLDEQEIRGPTSKVGVVFQDPTLFPWLSVLDNVAFGPHMKGIPKGVRSRAASSLISLVGLDGFQDSYPRELSGGMRQRVAIARALANEPLVLLMDEPFAALDAQTRRIMQDELAHIWQETGYTIVFVTHSISEALLLGDRVVIMTARPGRIKKTITPELNRPRSELDESFVEYSRELHELLAEEISKVMFAATNPVSSTDGSAGHPPATDDGARHNKSRHKEQ